MKCLCEPSKTGDCLGFIYMYINIYLHAVLIAPSWSNVEDEENAPLENAAIFEAEGAMSDIEGQLETHKDRIGKLYPRAMRR